MSAGPYSIGSDIWPGLSKLVEECGEVLQVVGKLIATGGSVEHWDRNSSLADALREEIADVMAACYFVVEENNTLGTMEFWNRIDAKLDKFRNWHDEQSAPTLAAAPVGNEGEKR